MGTTAWVVTRVDGAYEDRDFNVVSVHLSEAQALVRVAELEQLREARKDAYEARYEAQDARRLAIQRNESRAPWIRVGVQVEPIPIPPEPPPLPPFVATPLDQTWRGNSDAEWEVSAVPLDEPA